MNLLVVAGVIIIILIFIYYRTTRVSIVDYTVKSNESTDRPSNKLGNKNQVRQQHIGENLIKPAKRQNCQQSSSNSSSSGINGNGMDGLIIKKGENHLHPWLVTTLKGHASKVLDMDISSNGKYLASCDEDRKVLIWAFSQINNSKDRKFFRINVEYDFGTRLAWSPDNKAIAIHKSLANCIEVYKVEKKNGWFSNALKGLTFPSVTEFDVVGFGIACNGKFIMTCTNRTDLFIWDLRGNVLEKIDTYLITNYSGKISPCGRFVAACGFTSDVKIWEVKFTKNGEYQKTIKAFDLSGHASGIYDLAFDQDSSHIVTVSRDGTWRLFDTKIEYERGQLPKCLRIGKYTKSVNPSIVALSPNAEVLAIAGGTNVELFSTLTGERDIIIKIRHDGFINMLKFDPLGKYLFIVVNYYIRIFHNVTGYKTAILSAKNKLNTNLTSATRDRLEKLIIENQRFLKRFE